MLPNQHILDTNHSKLDNLFNFFHVSIMLEMIKFEKVGIQVWDRVNFDCIWEERFYLISIVTFKIRLFLNLFI